MSETVTPMATESAETGAARILIEAIEIEGDQVWIAGDAEPGTIVRLYQNNALLGEAETGDQGRWLYEGTLADTTGEMTVRADALGADANVFARAEVPFALPNREASDTVSAPIADEAVSQSSQPSEADARESTTSADAVEALDPVTRAFETAAADPTSDGLVGIEAPDNQVPDAQTTDTQVTAVEAPAAPASAPAVEAVEQNEVAMAAPNAETPAESAVAEPTVDTAAASPRPDPLQPDVSGTIRVLDTGRVIIRRGDNLWTLSRRVYGQGIRYTSIYDANEDQIRDPDLIFPGQVFDLPTPDADWGEVPGIEALEPDQIPPVEDTAAGN